MMHNSLIDCKKKLFFCVLFFLAVCGCPYIGTNNLFMHGDTIVPHAVMYHLHEAIATHLAHDATPVQQSVAPVSGEFGPFHEMRIVITDNPRQVDGGLQRALPVFGTVFIHVALVDAAVFRVKGHLIAWYGHGGNGHRSGGPVVLRLSLSLHSSLFLRSTDGFQMLFEINSIFFILYGVLK